MKEFMFFIRKPANTGVSLSPELHQQFLKSCETYIENLQKQGRLLSAQPIDWKGKIISGIAGDWSESSFSETGEVIGGYYHILANNIEEAIEIAKENPEFKFNKGSRIEVRPIKMKEMETGYVYPTKSI